MKYLRRTAVTLAALATVTACGGGGGHGLKLNAPKGVKPCQGTAYVMQCAHSAPGQKPGSPPKAFKRLPPWSKGVSSFRPLYGVDFAWGGPDGSLGWSIAISYLSGTSKDWTGSLLQSYTSRGRGVGFVYETTCCRPQGGYAAGYSDAWRAHNEIVSLGYPHAHVFMAADYDTTNTYGFLSYYYGARDYARRVGMSIGGYGGLWTVVQLCAHGIGPNWQTLAWSYGRWASVSCAPLRQTAINLHWRRFSVDYDVALASYWGQANVAPKPPPPPRLVCFGRHAHLSDSTCKKVRSYVARESRARDATLRAYVRRGCRQVHTARGSSEYRRRHCPQFAREYAFFRDRAHSTFLKYI